MRLDYLGGGVALVSTYLVGQKCWYGWALGVVANAVYLAIDIEYKLWGLIPVCILAIGISLRNVVKWYRER